MRTPRVHGGQRRLLAEEFLIPAQTRRLPTDPIASQGRSKKIDSLDDKNGGLITNQHRFMNRRLIADVSYQKQDRIRVKEIDRKGER
jgi:hypothetical protein